jgi:anti-anti-sigma factor
MVVQEMDGVVVVSLVEDQVTGLWKTIEPFLDAGRRHIVLELSQVSFLNSINIAAIIAARNKVVALEGKMMLADLNDRVKAIFKVLKLERLFELNRSTAAAIVAIR